MKKLMMGTAIALFATGAAAQEWSVDLSGTMTGGLGYVDIDQVSDDQEFNVVRDGEIFVDARLVADNGLTFGVDVEFEATGSENSDEAFLFVSGSFGRIEIGEADGAKDRYHYFGMVTGPWSSAQDGGGLLFDYYADESGNALDVPGFDTSDELKVSYFTPSIAGFSAGISYIPDDTSEGGDGNASAIQPTGDGRDAFEVGAGYQGSFGDFSFAAGIGYAEAPNDLDSIGGGVKGGFAGFEAGLSYSITEEGSDEVEQLGFGVSYSTGPWTFGGDYAVELDTPAGEPEQQGFAIGVSYALAPGVAVGASGEYLDVDTAGVDDALAFGTYIGLDF